MSKFSEILSQKLDGVNLSKLSRELKIPSTLLFEWKEAKRQPSFKNLNHVKQLAEYFGLSLDELLFGTNKATTISSVAFEDNNHQYRIKIERIK
jgi:hypothetical protein